MSLLNDGHPFRRADAGALGIDPRSLSRLVQQRRLCRVLRAVYVDATVPDTRDLRIHALALVLPTGAVAWGRTASWVWDVDAYSPGDQGLLVPECAVPHHAARPRYPGVRVVEAVLPSRAVVQLGPIALTTPARTAVDLARWSVRPMAMATLDAYAHVGLVTVSELDAEIGALRGFPGIRQARELLSLLEPLAESPGESWLRLRLIDAGFPKPRAQIVCCDAYGREVWRIDLGYEERRLGLEYDGMEYHDGRERHDESRRNQLRRSFGWDVYGFDRGDVLGRNPSLELFVGGVLGIQPRLPRRW